MQDLARTKGFRHRQLLDGAATSSAVVASIERAAQTLQAGDIFWLTYSGHGSQVPDPEEDDQRSETWVLWDRQLIDNELYALWGRFRPGVRVMICSDSCHSGTVNRRIDQLNAELVRATEAGRAGTAERVTLTPDMAIDLGFGLVAAIAPHLTGASPVARLDRASVVARQVIQRLSAGPGDRGLEDAAVPRARLLDPSLAAQDIAQRAPEYRRAVADRSATAAPTCSVLLIAACQDNQTASDGRPDPQGHQNGAFTRALREVWETAASYAEPQRRILQRMPSTQTPNLNWAAPRNAAFEAQPPFVI